MNKPTISLIVPVYGVERYIAFFADSVLGQSYPYMQFIFVNDGTKDRSMEVLQEVIDSKYPHRREQVVIVNKENGGLPAARRTGLDYVTGDYVYNVDPDDWLSPGSIEKIAATIEKTGCDIVYFNYVKEYANRSSRKCERLYTAGNKELYIRNMYNHKAFGTLCNKCIRYSLYSSNIIHTPRYGYAEDCFVSVQLVGYAGSLAYLDEDVYHYRKDNPGSMTRQGRKRRKREYAANFLDLYEKYREVPQAANPVMCIFDDIIMQAGWYSVFYNLGLFTQYPYLAAAVRKARIRTGSDVPLLAQLITKICVLFRR